MASTILRPAYFSHVAGAVAEIRAGNPWLSDALFYTVRDPSRPYLIANGSIIGPTHLSPFTALRLVGMVYTPLYLGTPFASQVSHTSN